MYKDLYNERNVHGGFKKGLYTGIVHAGLVSMITKVKNQL